MSQPIYHNVFWSTADGRSSANLLLNGALVLGGTFKARNPERSRMLTLRIVSATPSKRPMTSLDLVVEVVSSRSLGKLSQSRRHHSPTDPTRRNWKP